MALPAIAFLVASAALKAWQNKKQQEAAAAQAKNQAAIGAAMQASQRGQQEADTLTQQQNQAGPEYTYMSLSPETGAPVQETAEERRRRLLQALTMRPTNGI